MSINMLNTSRPFEINSSIVEWDMKRAGLNIIKEFQLLPEDVIEELSYLPKKDADIKIGKLQISNKEFSLALEQKFTDVMNDFLVANDLDREYDILAIKKDACFTINRRIQQSEFGKYLEFIPKNEYHAYIYLKPLEIYFKRNGDIEIKNLVGDKKERRRILTLHENGIINLLRYVIETAEKYSMDMNKLSVLLHEFVSMYKKKELDFDYYREFNLESKFRYRSLGGEVLMDNISLKMLDKVDIEYNYKNIILPLINLIC